MKCLTIIGSSHTSYSKLLLLKIGSPNLEPVGYLQFMKTAVEIHEDMTKNNKLNIYIVQYVYCHK